MQMRRHFRRRLKIRYRILLIGIILLIAALCCDASLRPTVTSIIEYQGRNLATQRVNDAVYAALETQGDKKLVEISMNADGNITSIETNTSLINQVQADLVKSVIDNLTEEESKSIGIPIGTLTNSAWLFDRGPEVSLQVLPVGAVKALVETEFLSAGVNQTIHQIVINIEVTVKVIIPGCTTEVVVPSKYILAETLIVGEVPDAYGQILLQREYAVE